MGLFTEYSTSVASMTQALVVGDRDPLKHSVVEAIFADRDIVEQIKYDLLRGGGLKLRAAYKYGQDKYFEDLPLGRMQGLIVNHSAVSTILSSIEGVPVTLNLVQMDYGNFDILKTDYLNTVRQLNIATNTLANPPSQSYNTIGPSEAIELDNTQTYADTKVAEYVTANTSSSSSTETVTSTDAQGNETEEEVTTTETKSASVYSTQSITSAADLTVTFVSGVMIPSTNYLPDNAYRITYKNTIIHAIRITYSLSVTTVTEVSNGNTTTEVVDSTIVENRPLTGIVYVTEDVSFLSKLLDLYYEVQYTPENGVKKLWTYNVADGTYPSLNPVQGTTIDSPFFPMIAIREDNQDLTSAAYQGTQQYITSKALLDKMDLDIDEIAKSINLNPDVEEIDHAYLIYGIDLNSPHPIAQKYLIDFFTYVESISIYNTTTFTSLPSINNLIIESGALKLEIRYNYITVTTHTGSIGRVGTVSSQANVLPKAQVAVGTSSSGNSDIDHIVYGEYEDSYMMFKQQLTDTTYKEVKVHGLVHVNHVYEEYTIETALSDSILEDNNAFIIPLNYGLIVNYNLKDLNALVVDCVNILFNSISITKLKWYQTNLFEMVLYAGAVYFGQPQIAGLGVAAASGLAGLLKKLLIQLLIQTITKAALKFVFSKTNNSFIKALVVIAAYFITREISVISGVSYLPFSKDLLQTVLATVGGYTSNIQDEIEDLQGEFADFKNKTKEQDSALAIAHDLLDVAGFVNPFLFIDQKPYFNPNESPEDFYNRTIPQGDLGALSIEAIGEYVNTQLQLPEPALIMNDKEDKPV